MGEFEERKRKQRVQYGMRENESILRRGGENTEKEIETKGETKVDKNEKRG